MRILIMVIILALASCSSGVKGKNGIVYKNATEYNQYIMENQKDIINVMLNFSKAISDDLDSADWVLDNGLETARKALDNIKGMPPFRSDSAFRNAAINSFEFYQQILGNEYKKIVSIRRKGENKTEEDIVFLQTLPATIGKREERYDRNFHNAQKEFAENNNLTLVKNELQDKIDKDDKKQ